jgi:thimet oligopeptidase
MLKRTMLVALAFVFCAGAAMAAYKTGNPLLTKEGYVDFSFTPDKMTAMTADAQKYLNAEIEKIVKIPKSKRTFQNTVEAFENALGEFHNRVETLEMAADFGVTEPVRNMGTELRKIVGKFKMGIFMRDDLYDALAEYKDTNPRLSKAQNHIFDKMIFEFKKNGKGLTPENLAKFKDLKSKIIDLQADFSKNLNAAKAFITLGKEDLKHIKDPSLIRAMKKTKDGKYRLDITMRDTMFSFLGSCSGEKLRDEAERNFTSKAGMKNVKLLEKALQYRQQLAKLMGFDIYANYTLQKEMAKNFKTSMDFAANLVSRLKVKAASDNVKFLALKHQLAGDNKQVTIGQNEWWYLANEYKKRHLNVDMGKIKEYFPTRRVVNKMVDIYGKIYGVKFKKANIPVYHPDVMAFRVIENGKTIGYSYLDLFPRDGKYTHAQSDDLIYPYRRSDGSYQYPVTLAMFTVDADTKDAPSLLDYEQMSTLFHEFGHTLQQLFNRSPYGSFGAETARDFVEVPSTIMEHWIDTPEMLKYLSGHYKTGKKLSDKLIKKLLASTTVGIGHYELWFATRTMFDQLIHSTDKKINPIKFYKKAHQDVRGHPMGKGAIMPSVFSHPMSWGYAGKYYCYRWSEVIAADLFSVFKKGGVFSSVLGRKFRRLIFAPGGTRDENEMVKSFLGRNYKQDAYFESLGIKLD